MILTDLRYAVRALATHPGVAIVSAVTLALGIGANTAIFSILNEVFLRPIPVVRGQNRLVVLGRTLDGRDWQGFTHPDYLEYRERSRTFDGLTAFRNAGVNLTCSGEVRQVRATLVSANYFDVLQVGAVRGRTFLPEEDQTPGTRPVAVVSRTLWANCLASDPRVLEKPLLLNGASFTVVGIAPDRFVGTDWAPGTEVWIPLMMEGEARPIFPVLNNRLFHSLTVVGRLRAGLTIGQAQAEMCVLARAVEPVDGRTKRQRDVTLSPNVALPDPEWRADARQIIVVLMVGVGIVLLVACANVANLLLARNATRTKEIAVRLALGATRFQLLRQHLAESLLLALLGGVLGTFVGMALTAVGRAFDEFLPLAPDLRVLGFTLLLSMLTAVLAGLVPALRDSKASLATVLKGGATEGGFRSSQVRRLLVVFQLSLSVMLIVAAGLFVRTMSNLQSIDLGFETGHLLTVPLDLRPQGYSDTRVRTVQDHAVERLATLPGVTSVSLARDLPVGGFMSTKREIQVVGRESTPTGTGGEADEDRVGARYFETLGVTVARGRAITDSDRPGSPLVVVVSESMARRLWPREDPIGRRIRLSRFMSWSPPHEVVGVVRDTRYRRLEHEIAPHLYVPLSQNPDVSVNVLIRTSLEPARLAEEVRRQVTAIDPSLPAPKVMTMAGHLRESDSDSRLVATFVGLFGALALALASIGVYSLTSYAVSQQTREIGVRVALGAGRRDVFGLVVREALVLALSGVAVGLAGAFASTRAIASQLYGVSATDPLTFAFASALLPVVGVLAACLPALRSMRIEPMAALREE